MLDRLVRPLIRTQIQLLTQTQSASSRLIGMISQWLGYLGVQAEVTHLQTSQETIQLSLTVNKPEQCSEQEWRKILENINQNDDVSSKDELTYLNMSQSQKSKVYRLLAHVIRAGNSDAAQSWEHVRPCLVPLGMEDSLLAGIKAALKAPTMLDLLLEDLEMEIAAFVLSKAIGVALIDQRINQDEDNALKAIYGVLETQSKD